MGISESRSLSIAEQLALISRAHAADNLREMQEILREASAEAASARAEVERIAQSLLAAELDDLVKLHAGVERWNSRQWSQWIVLMLQTRWARLKAEANPQLLAEHRAALEQNTVLKAKVLEAVGLSERLRSTETDLAAKQSAINQLQQQVAALNRLVEAQAEEIESLRSERTTATPSGDQTGADLLRIQPALPDEPASLATVRQSPDFMSIAELLYAMGKYGDCMRSGLESRLGELGFGRRQDTVIRGFDTIEAWRWIEVATPDPIGRGRSPQLVRLSPDGCEAYRRLFGSESCEPQFTRLLKRHKSATHVLLNLKAAEMLERHGARVDLYPEPVIVADAQTYQPDLVAITGQQSLYVECETMTEGDRPSADRARKWDGYRRVTSEFHVCVPGHEAQQRLYNEIALWQMQSRQAITLRICNLVRALDSDVLWTFERRLEP